MNTESWEDDTALTFCDQCGHLQPGVQAACQRCGVPLDRSVYDPFVAIHQNAAVVRQAVRGRGKPSRFGKFALLTLGALYLVYSAIYLKVLLEDPFSIVALALLLLHLAIGVLIFAGFRRMARRDTWAEYRLYDD
jgi:hypothetical protein